MSRRNDDGRSATHRADRWTYSQRSNFLFFLRVRYVIIVAAAVALVLTGGGEPRRTPIAAGVLTVLLPYNALLEWRARRSADMPAAGPWIDLAAAQLVVTIEPSLWPPGLVLSLAGLALPAAVLPWRRAVPLALFACAGFVAAGAVIGFHETGVDLVAFMLATPLLFLVVMILARRSEVETARRSDVLAGTQAVSWEYDLARSSFTFVSDLAEELVGVPAADWRDHPAVLLDRVHPDDRHVASRVALLDAATSGEPMEIRFLHAGETTTQSWWRIVVTAVGAPVRLLRGVMVEVSDLHRAEAAMRQQALRDALTDLPNRHAVQLHLAELCDADVDDLALLLIDFDRFKDVNDALGHQAGDRLLAAMAGRLSAICSPSLVGRLGGDEFAVVLSAEAAGSALALAEAVHEELTAPLDIDGVTLMVGVSVGVARPSRDERSMADILRQADVAMYRAKRMGGGISSFVHEADRDRARAVGLLADLRRTLAGPGIEIVVQPITSAVTFEIVGAEVLARWNHPELGPIEPAEFVPLAEMSGLIHRLALSALSQAIRVGGRWHACGHHLDVSVNLSAMNLLAPEIVDLVETLPAQVGLPWSSLLLEITESQVMEQSDLVLAALDRCTALGIRLSIDDFGTGHSSLARLRELPFAELKIDRTFISGLGGDGVDDAIVRALVDVGHSIGLVVVAEGVETDAEVRHASALGCDLLQGYALHRPMSLDAFDALLDTRRQRRRSLVHGRALQAIVTRSPLGHVIESTSSAQQ